LQPPPAMEAAPHGACLSTMEASRAELVDRHLRSNHTG
jgi:hypothetical protein